MLDWKIYYNFVSKKENNRILINNKIMTILEEVINKVLSEEGQKSKKTSRECSWILNRLLQDR